MILHQIESVFVEEFGFSSVGQFTKTFATYRSCIDFILWESKFYVRKITIYFEGN